MLNWLRRRWSHPHSIFVLMYLILQQCCDPIEAVTYYLTCSDEHAQIWHARLRCAARMLEGEESFQELDVHWNDHGVIHLKWSPHNALLTCHLIASTVLWHSPKPAGSLAVSVRALNLTTSPRVRGELGVKDVRGSPVLVLTHLCQWPCKEWPGCGDHRCCLLQLENWTVSKLLIIVESENGWFLFWDITIKVLDS